MKVLEERIREKQVKVDKLEEQHEHIQQSCPHEVLHLPTSRKTEVWKAGGRLRKGVGGWWIGRGERLF